MSKDNDDFYIECLTGLRKIKVKLINYTVGLITTQKVKTSEGIEDREIASVKFGTDELLAFLNEIHRCLPLTIKTKKQADDVQRIGYPISADHLTTWIKDHPSRHNNLSNRGFFITFSQCFIESASDEAMEILADVYRDLLDKDFKHSVFLRQHLDTASSQLQNTINLKNGVKNENEEKYFWGAPCDDDVIDISELTGIKPTESKTE